MDARLYQIAFLACFLGFILGWREFTLPWPFLAAIVAATLLTQAVFARLHRLPDRGLRSALISALSLCLLLRTNDLWVAALASFLAIASKFTLRVRGKHVFNPTNFGLLATVLLTGQAWVSPGQWGSQALLAFAVAALGIAVTRAASRLDISLAYLAAHSGLLVARMLALGERPEVVVHRLGSGALLLFVFFMVSDPRSTPDSRGGRILFAALVAAVAHVIQFRFFVPAAPLWALFLVSPVTPLIDALWRRPRFTWGREENPARARKPALA